MVPHHEVLRQVVAPHKVLAAGPAALAVGAVEAVAVAHAQGGQRRAGARIRAF